MRDRSAAFLYAAMVFFAALARDTPARAQAGEVRGKRLSSARWVELGCINPGIQQDTAKTPLITNTTAAAIPRGRTVFWRASDGDSGGVTLGKDLVPGDSVNGTGNPARVVYSCTARFDAGLADLIVVSTDFDRTPTAVIANTNAWIDATDVRVRFELLKCADHSVVALKHVGPWTVSAGVRRPFAASVSKFVKRPHTYFRVSIDVENRVPESNESNNIWSGQSFCAG